MRTSRWQIVVVLLVVVMGLALVGSWARHSLAGTCALDGAEIDPVYQVRVVDEEGQSHAFCCIRCAELWQQARDRTPQAIFVTDEASGQEVNADEAFFVRSSVLTRATTQNRIHAFKHRADAERHATTALGRVLTGAEIPLGRKE
jgi:nitrous oxide reductase accessory protein NosL